MFIPLEVQQQIGTFLDPKDYHRFRISSRYIQLPLVQRLLPTIYLQHYSPHIDPILQIELQYVSQTLYDTLLQQNVRSGVVQLIKYGIDIGDDVFLWAVRNEYTDIVEMLLDDPRVDPAMLEQEALADACSRGYVDIVRLLLKDSRMDPSANDDVAIRFAASEGHLQVVEVLLEDDCVDPSAYDNEALIEACSEGHVDVVKRLLEDERVDPSNDDNHALIAASRRGHVPIVEMLLQDERVDFEDAFLICCTEGQADVLKVFLNDPRVDPSMGNNHPIKEASSEGHLKVVELLLKDERVDPRVCIKRAARYGHHQVLDLLLHDPRSQDVDLTEVLHFLENDGIQDIKVIKCLYNYSKETFERFAHI